MTLRLTVLMSWPRRSGGTISLSLGSADVNVPLLLAMGLCDHVDGQWRFHSAHSTVQ